eukprot:1609951-Pyramimonas_sp.AAC.1
MMVNEAQPQSESPEAHPAHAVPHHVPQLGFGRFATSNQETRGQEEQGDDSTSLCQMAVQTRRIDGA